MTRYTVAENQFGYEINGSDLRFAVVDNRPDKVSLYRVREQALKLYGIEASLKAPPRRQVAFCAHREDAENLAAALNGGVA